MGTGKAPRPTPKQHERLKPMQTITETMSVATYHADTKTMNFNHVVADEAFEVMKELRARGITHFTISSRQNDLLEAMANLQAFGASWVAIMDVTVHGKTKPAIIGRVNA